MIDLTIHEEQLKRTIERAREKNIIIPTFQQMKDPELIPQKFKENLKDIGLWDINSYNLFRITWKNEPLKNEGAKIAEGNPNEIQNNPLVIEAYLGRGGAIA